MVADVAKGLRPVSLVFLVVRGSPRHRVTGVPGQPDHPRHLAHQPGFGRLQVHRESSASSTAPSSTTCCRRNRRFRTWTSRIIRPRRNPRPVVRPTLAPTITSAPGSAGGVAVSTSSADSTHGMAPELVKLDVRRATRSSCPRRRCSGRPSRSGVTEPRWSVALKGPLTGSRPKSFAGSSKGGPWSSGRSTPREASRPSGSGWKHIETVYTHINQLDENHLSSDDGLLTMVVAFRTRPPGTAHQADGRAVRDHRGNPERSSG